MASTLDTLGPIELPSSIYNVLNVSLGPISGFVGDTASNIARLCAVIPFGSMTLDIVQWLFGFLIEFAPSAPPASSMYETNPSQSAVYMPPWWANFASYVAMWGWPLLLKRNPGHGYRILADTDRMRRGEYDEPAYMEGLRPPVVGG